MENKYFTPDVTDICVGYECEKGILDYSSTGNTPLGWEQYVFKNPNLREDDLCVFAMDMNMPLRTQYLTTKQIEAEGWVKQDNSFNETQRVAWVPDYILETTFGSLRLYISNTEEPYKDICIERYTKSDPNNTWSMSGKWVVYRGVCKDINTFRKICKLLNI